MRLQNFTAASVHTSAVPGAGSILACEAGISRGAPLVDLDDVPSGSVPVSAKAGDVNTIENTVADLIGDLSLSHSSASHAVSASSLAGINDDKPLEVAKDPPSPGVTSHVVVAPSAATGVVSSLRRSLQVILAPRC